MVSVKVLVVLALIAATATTADATSLKRYKKAIAATATTADATSLKRYKKANCGIGKDGFIKGLGSVFNGLGGVLNAVGGILGNLLQPRKPTGFSSSIDLTVDLSLGCGRLLDRTLIGGLGNLLAKIYIAISKITVCILGPANCKVCQGSYLGIGPVKAKTDISVFLKTYGLLNLRAQIQAMIQKRSKKRGISYFSPSQQVVLNAGLQLADILSVNIGKQDLPRGLVQLSIMAGAIGTTRSKKDGLNIAGGLVDTCNAHLDEEDYTVITDVDYQRITSTLAKCNNDNGAFEKVIKTEISDDDNKGQDDDTDQTDKEREDKEGADKEKTEKNKDSKDKFDKVKDDEGGDDEDGDVKGSLDTIGKDQFGDDNRGNKRGDDQSDNENSGDDEEENNEDDSGLTNDKERNISNGLGLGGLGNTVRNLFGVLKGATKLVGSVIDSLLNFKNPKNFDDSAIVSVQLFQGFGNLLDVSFIKGLGSLVTRIFVLISKISICLLGKVNCSVCNNNYAGIGQISGDIKAVIKNAGLSNCNQDIKNLINKKSNGKGITSFTVAEQIVLNNILDLSLLLNAKITKQTFPIALKIGITIFGTIGNTYSVQDNKTGDNITSGLVDACGKYLTKQGFNSFSETEVSVIVRTIGKAKKDTKAAWCVKK